MTGLGGTWGLTAAELVGAAVAVAFVAAAAAALVAAAAAAASWTAVAATAAAAWLLFLPSPRLKINYQR